MILKKKNLASAVNNRVKNNTYKRRKTNVAKRWLETCAPKESRKNLADSIDKSRARWYGQDDAAWHL